MNIVPMKVSSGRIYDLNFDLRRFWHLGNLNVSEKLTCRTVASSPENLR